MKNDTITVNRDLNTKKEIKIYYYIITNLVSPIIDTILNTKKDLINYLQFDITKAFVN